MKVSAYLPGKFSVTALLLGLLAVASSPLSISPLIAAEPPPTAEPPPAESPKQSQAPAKPWDGLQLQPGDDALETFKPLQPVTQDEEQRKSALAWYGVSHYEYLKGRLEKSYDALKKAHLADPDSPQILFMLLQLAVKIHPDQNQEIYDYCLKLSEISPQESANVIRQLGTALSSSASEIPRAIRLYEQAAKSPKINRQSAFYVFLMRELGKLYLATKRLPESADCYETLFDALRNHEKFGLSNRERRELANDQAASPEKLADVFLEAGRFDLARQAYEFSAKGRKSAEGMLHYNLARVELKQNAPEKALAELDQFFTADFPLKGKGPLDLLSQILTSLNRQSELLGRLEGYLVRKPDSSVLMTYLADRYADADRLADAEKLLRKVLEEDNDAAAYIALAKVSRRQNKFPEFLDNLALAYGRKDNVAILEPELALFAKEPPLWDSLWTVVQARLKEAPPTLTYDAAFVAAKAAMQSKQTAPVADLIKYAASLKKSETGKLFGELADYYLEVDLYTEAGDILKQGAEDPNVGEDRPNFLIQASQAYELGGKTDAALQMLAEARKSIPDHPLLIYQEGWVYSHAGRYEEAIAQFEKAIQKAEELGMPSLIRSSRLNLSNAYVQKGDMKKGEEILEIILKESPDDPSVNNDLGYLYADQGKNLEQAEQMITKAIQAEPDNGAYLDSMGWILHKRGKHQEALEYLIKSSETSQTGSDATIWDHLGDVYQALNRTDEAKKNWTKALELAKAAPKPNGELISKIEAKLK